MLQSTAYSYFAFQAGAERVITTPERLQYAENVLRAGPKCVAYDTETTGLQWWRGDRPCGCSFATRVDGKVESFYVPYAHVTGQPQLSPDKVVQFQKVFLEDPEITKIAHNIKFDEHMARQDGIALKGPRIDTVVEARLFDENRGAKFTQRMSEDLGDPNAQLYDSMLTQDITRLAKVAGMSKKAYKKAYGYSGLDIYLCGIYASYDAYGAFMLHEWYEQQGVREFYSQSPRQVPGARGIWETEMRLTEVLCEMERVGIPVDVEQIHVLHQHLLKEAEIAETSFFTESGFEWFNLGSDDELRDRLLSLKVPLTKRTDKGNLSVDDEVLHTAAAMWPAVTHVIRWREVTKKSSTYTLSLLEFCDENGTLHCSLKQSGTNTGRLAAVDPNMQNQPSDDPKRKKANGGKDPESVKRLFTVKRGPADPFHNLSVRLLADYSQAELRVLAHYTRDPRLVQTYLDDGDVHDEVEFAVFGTGRKTSDGPVNRVKAKTINFGLSYCMSALGFTHQVPGVTQEQAEYYFAEYNRKFPGVNQFRQSFWQWIRANGCHFQNMFGRSRRIPDMVSGSKAHRKRAERRAIATLIQGTAADMMKDAMVRVFDWLRAEDLQSRMTLTVHDELQTDTPPDEIVVVAEGVAGIMADYPDLAVPMRVDVEYSITNWADKQPLSLA